MERGRYLASVCGKTKGRRISKYPDILHKNILSFLMSLVINNAALCIPSRGQLHFGGGPMSCCRVIRLRVEAGPPWILYRIYSARFHALYTLTITNVGLYVFALAVV